MPTRSLTEDDSLDDFQARSITLDGITKTVHVTGKGPAVIVMAEMPGISPHVARFARWVRDAGFTVEETFLTPMDVYCADEAFLTGTAAEIIGMVSLDGRKIGCGTPGDVTLDIMKRFREHVATGVPF